MTNLHCFREGAAGRVVLDRPEALNALNLDMVRGIAEALDGFEYDRAVQAVTIEGKGDRAFCAGGDVISLYRARETGTAFTAQFFREEYALNRRLKRFPKPVVAFMDGITMGGGVGLSVHVSHRVVTERTVFAMPEVGIGFFPDVGAGYVLARLAAGVGAWMALTGSRLRAGDCLDLGLATHALDATATVSDAVRAVAEMENGVDEALAPFLGEPAPGDVDPLLGTIARCFGHDNLPTILQALANEGTPWANRAQEQLARQSPTSLRITIRQLELARSASFEANLVTEFRMSQACIAGHDFMEGIRAALVDRDRSPRWRPDKIADVTDELVDAHFVPPPSGDLEFA